MSRRVSVLHRANGLSPRQPTSEILTRLLADEHDPRFQRNAPVQILDVVVDKPDASGSNEMPDGLRRIRAVNNQPRLVQQQRACTQ